MLFKIQLHLTILGNIAGKRWKEIVNLFEIDGDEINPMQFQINATVENTRILRKSDNWLKLAFLESLEIKEHAPKLNSGIKSCKDLSLF